MVHITLNLEYHSINKIEKHVEEFRYTLNIDVLEKCRLLN